MIRPGANHRLGNIERCSMIIYLRQQRNEVGLEEKKKGATHVL